MQAKPPAVATSLTTERIRRQVEWARRENDRRRRAYDAQVEAWRRREEHLVRLRIEAAGFLGCTQPRHGLPAELDHDEVVYRILPTAELVEAEARHLTGLPTPGLTLAAAPVDEPGRVVPAGLRVVDAGMAVVTDRRVVFAGHAGRREWTYAGLRGLGHHPDVPITLLHTADHRRPAGLRVPAATAVNARFYLTLAFATATGARPLIVPQLDALLAAHRDARPAPPPPVAPDDAPLPLLRPERAMAAAAVAVAVAFAALTTGGFRADPAELPYQAQARADGVATAPADGAAASPLPSPPTVPEPDRPGPRPPSPATAARPAGGAAGGPVVPRATGPSIPPGARATTQPTPTAHPAPTTAPAPPPARPPTAAPSPTPTQNPTTAPSPAEPAEPPARTGCLDLLQLPLLERLLCPPSGSGGA
ncbi:hypothetical protein GA0074695_3458 [Micromonospora viridifaciens]|uniref:Uncharacterized protein n=1 Tax=Micromonospora viridifaciens TaxID=1881 RepID=A0A1C4XMY2_MICVI|nr:hypothetical protein [Micromonospora viridifaciens]SCF09837.1 hypothetical protein GA0074695_3458 [Micromonospora viridifaciens]